MATGQPQFQVHVDDEVVTFGWYDDSGDRIDDSGSLTISLGDLRNALSGHREASFRFLNWNDADTCVKYRALVLMTEPEPAS